MEIRKIAVIGAGPVGCVLAACLARGGHAVTLCDIAPERVAAARERGIRVEGVESFSQPVGGTCTRVDRLAEVDPDAVFVTVKATALPLLASAVESFHRPGMWVVSWQNGIDTEAVLAEHLGRRHVLRAVVNYGCSLLEPARVRLAFHHPPHHLQALDPESAPAAEALADLLSGCGLPTEHTDRIVSHVWRKSIMNASMNPLCAVAGLTMAQTMRDPIVFQIVDLLIKEGVRVARANEISLGWDYYPYCMEYLKGAGDHRPSMLVDLDQGRRTEVDFINGKIVAYGEQAGVDTPYNRMVRALVKAVESRPREG